MMSSVVPLDRWQRPYSGRLVVDHLHKTAGQAVHAWLRARLGSGCVTPPLDLSHRQLISRYGGDYSVLYAHTQFFGEGLDPRYQYATCLREPVDRAISRLYFLINNHTVDELGTLYQQIRSFLTSAGEDLQPDLQRQLSNPYVKHFCKIKYRHEALSDPLAVAWDALQSYELCGLYEDLPGYVARLAGLVGIPPMAAQALAPYNVTRLRPALAELTPALRRRLEDLTALDGQLYERLRRETLPGPSLARRRGSGWRRQVPDRVRTAAAALGASTAVAHADRLPYERRPLPDYCAPDFQLLDVALNRAAPVTPSTSLQLTVHFSLARPITYLVVRLHICDSLGCWAFGIDSDSLGLEFRDLAAGAYCLEHEFSADLPDGDYGAGLGFTEGPENAGRELAWFQEPVRFTVQARRARPSLGYADLDAHVRLRTSSGAAVGGPGAAAPTVQAVRSRVELAIQGLERDLDARYRELAGTRAALEETRQMLADVHASRSWKLTAPLRSLTIRRRRVLAAWRAAPPAVAAVVRTLPRRLLRRALHTLSAHPGLRGFALAALNRFPRIKARLKRLLHGTAGLSTPVRHVQASSLETLCTHEINMLSRLRCARQLAAGPAAGATRHDKPDKPNKL